MSLITNEPRTAKIRAMDYCELFILYKDTFERIMEKYPDFNEKIQDIFRKRLSEIKGECEDF